MRHQDSLSFCRHRQHIGIRKRAHSRVFRSLEIDGRFPPKHTRYDVNIQVRIGEKANFHREFDFLAMRGRFPGLQELFAKANRYRRSGGSQTLALLGSAAQILVDFRLVR